MKINTDGYNVYYDITPAKEHTVVILQGWGTTRQAYRSAVEALKDEYMVVSLDLPGFGDSDEPREAWGVNDYVVFLRKFLNALNITKASFVGHSYGGRMMIRLASDKAANKAAGLELEKLCFIDSAGIKPTKSFTKRFKEKRYKFFKKLFTSRASRFFYADLPDEWMKRQGSEDYRNASPVMKQCLVKAVNEDLSELLPLIDNETLLIWGDKDTATPLSDGMKFKELIKGSSLSVLQGAGHYSFIDRPAEFKSLIQTFFIRG